MSCMVHGMDIIWIWWQHFEKRNHRVVRILVASTSFSLCSPVNTSMANRTFPRNILWTVIIKKSCIRNYITAIRFSAGGTFLETDSKYEKRFWQVFISTCSLSASQELQSNCIQRNKHASSRSIFILYCSSYPMFVGWSSSTCCYGNYWSWYCCLA